MPTFDKSKPFESDYERPTPAERRAFKDAVAKFVVDLRRGSFRKGLRVKRYQREEGLWEMTWANDGRALFRYGPSILVNRMSSGFGSGVMRSSRTGSSREGLERRRLEPTTRV